MTHYSLEDHAQAISALALLKEKWENYSGNNPNKFRADMESERPDCLLSAQSSKRPGYWSEPPRKNAMLCWMLSFRPLAPRMLLLGKDGAS